MNSLPMVDDVRGQEDPFRRARGAPRGTGSTVAGVPSNYKGGAMSARVVDRKQLPCVSPRKWVARGRFAKLVASLHGQPTRGAGAGAVRILPVRGPVVSRRMLSSNPSPSRQSATSMNSVLPSAPPRMQAKQGRSVSTRCSTSPPSRTRSTLVPLAPMVEHQMAPSASKQIPSPV
jgi:hypothetical protein